MNTMTSSACTFAQKTSRPREISRPATFVPISTPRKPRRLTQYSSSSAAASGACSGTSASATNRSGCFWTIAARFSLIARAVFAAELRVERIHELEGRARDRLDVDAHLVHIAQPLLDGREADEHVLRVLLVRGVRQIVREPHRRLILAPEDVFHHLVRGRVVDVAVDVDAEVTAASLDRSRLATARYRTRTGEEHGHSPYVWVSVTPTIISPRVRSVAAGRGTSPTIRPSCITRMRSASARISSSSTETRSSAFPASRSATRRR